MVYAFIAAGSNLGDRANFLERARDLLRKIQGIQFKETSSVYETEPVGGPRQGKYLNAVWEIETSLAPGKLLEALLEIEKKLGRMRGERNAPREIDLDILSYGEEIVDRPGLTIPHPRLHERRFVLEPLAELDPDWRHPVFKKTVREMLNHLNIGAGFKPAPTTAIQKNHA